MILIDRTILWKSVKYFSDDSDMEIPGFQGCWDDQLWRQQEPISASISQFHGKGVLNSSNSQNPIQRSSTGNIQDAGNTTNLIFFTTIGTMASLPMRASCSISS